MKNNNKFKNNKKDLLISSKDRKALSTLNILVNNVCHDRLNIILDDKKTEILNAFNTISKKLFILDKYLSDYYDILEQEKHISTKYQKLIVDTDKDDMEIAAQILYLSNIISKDVYQEYLDKIKSKMEAND